MKKPATTQAPSADALAAALGPTASAWRLLVEDLEFDFPGLKQEWKPTKLEFGRVCLLKHKARTLVYLIPRQGDFEASVVLGPRAVILALAGDLPASTKRLIEEAKPYVEGRSIRFPVSSLAQVDLVRRLVACKVAPL
ncbi:MAG TPA: DUF3788 family protein [Opitutaceae bacterium]|nr:DUF3788 family protein [Opitutaceae bacterium]